MKAREEYELLKSSGMMWEFHPQFKGMWKEDRLEWFKIQGIITDETDILTTLKLIFDNESQEETLADWEMSCYGCRKSIRDAQYARVLHYICNLSPILLESEFERFLKWETKYEEFQYDHRHKQTSSTLFNTLIDIIRENYSNDIDSDKDFSSECFSAKGYVFTLFVGQGAFWRIEKDGKTIFQNM